jgi:OOP family OmpA-OmpF porin
VVACTAPTILEGLNFASNAVEIDPVAAKILDALVADLARCPDVRIRIEAHTDSVGNAGYNQRLSQNRAESVRDYLVRQGTPKERLQTVGHGERRPIASNENSSGRALNRRVEIHPLVTM